MKTVMNYIIYLALAGGLLMSLGSCDSKKEPKEVAEKANDNTFETRKNEKDAQFVVDAISASYDGVQFAAIAEKKSVNPEVKEAAKKIQAQHQALIKDLKGLAAEKGISVPIQASDAAIKRSEDLAKESEDDFDKKWYHEMIDRHEKYEETYERAINTATDGDIKRWALSNVTTVRAHLSMLKLKEDNFTSSR